MMFSILDSKNMKAGALMMLKRWASIGYTGIVDLMGATGIRIMRPELFIEMEKEGTLPLRINYCCTIFNLDDVDKAAMYKSEKFNTELVHFLGCKIFVDGAFGGGYAWTSWTNLQGNQGVQEIFTDDMGGAELNLNRIVAKVEEYGMNMHYHTQGDMAISAVLNALDKVIAQKGTLLGIHTLIHVAFPTDEQIDKIRQYNGHVVVTTQPAFWPVHEGIAHYYGERAAQRYPIKKLMHKGYKADIVVYEKDLYSIPAEKFTQDYPRVMGTYIGGLKVF
jgi:predicted amidohydrolase YtcJ